MKKMDQCKGAIKQSALHITIELEGEVIIGVVVNAVSCNFQKQQLRRMFCTTDEILVRKRKYKRSQSICKRTKKYLELDRWVDLCWPQWLVRRNASRCSRHHQTGIENHLTENKKGKNVQKKDRAAVQVRQWNVNSREVKEKSTRARSHSITYSHFKAWSFHCDDCLLVGLHLSGWHISNPNRH